MTAPLPLPPQPLKIMSSTPAPKIEDGSVHFDSPQFQNHIIQIGVRTWFDGKLAIRNSALITMVVPHEPFLTQSVGESLGLGQLKVVLAYMECVYQDPPRPTDPPRRKTSKVRRDRGPASSGVGKYSPPKSTPLDPARSPPAKKPSPRPSRRKGRP